MISFLKPHKCIIVFRVLYIYTKSEVHELILCLINFAAMYHKSVVLVVLFAAQAMASSLDLFRAMVYVQSLGDAHLYRPIYKFDRSSSEYCYPDYPSSANDGRCIRVLNN